MAGQGTEYATFIHDELSHEYERRDLVNARAATAITSATGLVTITLAVLAVLKGKDFKLTGGALTALFLGLFALLASAVLAVLAGLNWKYRTTSIVTMRRMLSDHWGDTEITARAVTAYCNIETLKSLRQGTSVKFRFMLAAGLAQIAAILALSTTALVVLT